MLVPPLDPGYTDVRRRFHRSTCLLYCGLILFFAAALSKPSSGRPFKIAVLNAFVDTWRLQMLETLKAANDELKAKGLTTDLEIQSGNTDVQGQIAQIRSLLSRDIDALLFIPSSESALNPVLREVNQKGVKAIAITQDVTAKDVLGVMIDQGGWAQVGAEWLVKTLDAKGNVIIVNGLAGAPANEVRFKAVQQVFGAASQIKVLNVVNGDWDQVRAQNVTSSILAAQPVVDGIWVSGAMSEGVLKALLAANRNPLPAVTGDSNLGYLRLWQSALADHPDFKSIGIIDPPGLAATAALRLAVAILQGKKLKPDKLAGSFKNQLYIPLPNAIQENDLARTLKEHSEEPNSRYVDVVADDSHIAELLQP
jgi:ribose transport system substrate-binding protein